MTISRTKLAAVALVIMLVNYRPKLQVHRHLHSTDHEDSDDTIFPPFWHLQFRDRADGQTDCRSVNDDTDCPGRDSIGNIADTVATTFGFQYDSMGRQAVKKSMTIVIY